MPHVTLNIRVTAAATSTEGSTPELGHAYVVSASVSSVPESLLKDLISPEDPGTPNDPTNPENPGKPAQAAFIISSDIEQTLHQILVESALRGPEETGQRAKRLGIELFNYLFQPEIQTLYRNIKERAVQQKQPFVIRLRLKIVPAELSTLPWELLHDGEQYLCLSDHPKILFARVPDTMVNKRTLNYDPPLRLLGITASPDGQDKLNVEKEKEYIDTALEKLVEEKRTAKEWKKAEENVLSRLRSGDTVHILHFIGHGEFRNQEGKIIFEDTRGRGVEIDAHRLSLALHTNTQLVFLNACDTARGAPQDYFSNFAYKLAVSKIPAIVAMQFKITDDVAIEFAKTFYERIAAGEAIDEAVTEARHQIFVYTGSLEWIAPVLYISSTNSVLFKSSKLPKPPDKPIRRPFSRLQLFAAILAFLFLLGTLGGWWIFGHMNPPASTTLCLATDLPTTIGPTGEIGRAIQNGVELARMDSSLNTRYHDHDLKTLYMDDTSVQQGGPDPTIGAKNVQNLFQQSTCPNPIALIGPYDSPTAAVEIPLAARNHLLLLSPSASAPCLTQEKYTIPQCEYNTIHSLSVSNTFARLPGDDRLRGDVVANFMLASPNPQHPEQGGLGAKRIAVIGDEAIAGTQLSQIVIDALKNKGVMPVSIDCIKPTEEYKQDHFCSQLSPSTEAFSIDNLAPLAAKIRDQQPDAIFFSGRPDRGAGPLRKQLGEAGLDNIPFVGIGSLISAKQDLFSTLGSHAGNIYAIFPASDPSTSKSPAMEALSKEYQKVFGKMLDSSAVTGYDAANIILQATKGLIDAGQPVTRENVAQAVLSGNFTGVDGNTIRFNTYGDNIGKQVYTIYKSQQQPQGPWDFNVFAEWVV